MSKKYEVIVYVNKDNGGSVLLDLHKNFPKCIITSIGEKKSILRYLLQTKSDSTKDVLKHEITSIDGVEDAEIGWEKSKLSKFPKKLSTYIMIVLAVSWIIISFIAFTLPDNFIDQMSNSQLLMIEIFIVLAISVWIFLYDKKTQEYVIDVLADLDLATGEIRENVKDIAKNF